MSARDTLRLYSWELASQSADKHAEGIALSRTSARIEQLADIASDDQLDQLLASLIEEGAIVPLSGGGDA